MAYRKGQENLIPVTKRSKEEMMELSRRGGIKSGEARRNKKQAVELAKLVLDLTPEMPDVVKRQVAEMGIKTKKPDARTIAMCAMMRKAMAGDQKSYEFMLGLTGELPSGGGTAAEIEDDEETAIDSDRIRNTLDSMSDEQLRSYQELCSMFSNTAAEADEDE